MADPYLTEEDQIRAIRQWWERNGSSTLISVGLALAIVFGWQYWQQHRQTSAEEAAALYQQLQQAVELARDDEVQRTTAKHLGEQLLETQPSGRYGDYANLMLARLAAEADDLAGAEQQLRAVIARHPAEPPGALRARFDALLGREVDPQLGTLARLRLARVLIAQSRHDDAAALLGPESGGDFEIERTELRGDILREQGDHAAALAAYERAMDLAKESGSVRLLELKLEEQRLRQATPAAPAEEPAPSTTSPAAPATAEGDSP
jgi:predicted negative regulator of RcsB-dependent stress response